jgi:hypothetical protein
MDHHLQAQEWEEARPLLYLFVDSTNGNMLLGQMQKVWLVLIAGKIKEGKVGIEDADKGEQAVGEEEVVVFADSAVVAPVVVVVS